MANDHGRLPKADPTELDEDMSRRLSTWFDKAYADAIGGRTVAADVR